MNLPDHKSLPTQRDANRQERSVRTRSQTELLIEPVSVFTPEVLHHLIDHWLAPVIAEHFLRDLISSGENKE